ncbi:MAG: pantoate--beta-alanine ligase [Bacillota bacterium]|jgi:pantoate--beta-alanine ligase
MDIINNPEEMQNHAIRWKRKCKRVGLVPTMGYLHQGHLALMQEARKNCDLVIVSIFVNPMQFGQGEDYEVYPRDLAKDAQLAESVGVDVIFAPSTADMYPKNYHTFVDIELLTDHLCGLSRPGHFKGVATVVTKLFNITQPDIAYFGQKDAQQVIVIKRMVADLNMPVDVVCVPTVREEDGLAMSSRNVYLNEEERQQAPVLYRSLKEAQALVEQGERNALIIKNRIKEIISQASLACIDYVEIVDEITVQPVDKLEGKILIALAVRFGQTRLIDNILLEV